MSGRFLARNQVAMVGYAQSQVVRRSPEPLGITALKTARAAIADAGLSVDQIDGFASASLLPSSGDHVLQDGVSIVTSNWLSRGLGVTPRNVVGFQGLGQIVSSLTLAVNALAAGAADYVLVHRALSSPPGKYNDNPMTHAEGEAQWSAPQGFFGALPAIAMAYNEYCQRYGATRESMAQLVVEARKNGARNPWSYWAGKPLTVEQYLAEPMINDPMTRLDCDIPVHGVGAYILTRADRARDLPHKPVYVSGFASAQPRINGLNLHWTLDEMEEAGSAIAQQIWEKSGYGPKDVQIPQFYDGFSPFIYIWMEALGFCPRGEAHRFILDGGIDSDDPKSLPVISGGGAIGNGRLHGIPQLVECYRQLSGRAGERQRDASVGMLTYSAPHFGGTAMVFSNDPD